MTTPNYATVKLASGNTPRQAIIGIAVVNKVEATIEAVAAELATHTEAHAEIGGVTLFTYFDSLPEAKQKRIVRMIARETGQKVSKKKAAPVEKWSRDDFDLAKQAVLDEGAELPVYPILTEGTRIAHLGNIGTTTNPKWAVSTIKDQTFKTRKAAFEAFLDAVLAE